MYLKLFHLLLHLCVCLHVNVCVSPQGSVAITALWGHVVTQGPVSLFALPVAWVTCSGGCLSYPDVSLHTGAHTPVHCNTTWNTSLLSIFLVFFLLVLKHNYMIKNGGLLPDIIHHCLYISHSTGDTHTHTQFQCFEIENPPFPWTNPHTQIHAAANAYKEQRWWLTRPGHPSF